MPCHFSIAPDVSYCKADGRIVFLDLNNERYFQLNERQTGWFDRLIADGSDGASAPEWRLAKRLKDMGLLTEASEQTPPLTDFTRYTVSTSLLDYPHKQPVRASLADLPPIGWTAALTVAALRFSRLRTVLKNHSSKKSDLGGQGPVPAAVGRSLAARFIAWSPALFTSHDACLFRSLALARFLLANHFPTDIVIGVRSQPFRAHCWVQAGEMVFNEHLEIARDYCPVLVS